MKIIKSARPELADRVTTVDPTAADSGVDTRIVEWDRLEKILGFKKNEDRSLDDTVLGAIDAVVDLEKTWKHQD